MSWFNSLTRVGMNFGRTAFSFLRDVELSDQELEDLFHGDGMASKVCSIVPEEATRQGLTIKTGNPDWDSGLDGSFDALNVLPRFAEAWTFARVFGGACVLIGADDGLDPRLPLDESAIRSVRFLTVLDKRELLPCQWYDVTGSGAFGEPSVYRLSRSGHAMVDTREVHATRLIRFDGPLTTRRRRRQRNHWNISEIQRIIDALRDCNAAWAAASTLMQDASTGVFKMRGLADMMSADRFDTLKNRLDMMDILKGVGRSIFVDADNEDYDRVESSVLSSVPETIDRQTLRLAAVSQIPVTLLLGQSPAGLNATGDSDIRGFYDRLKSTQARVLGPRVRRLARILCAAQDGPTGGQIPKHISLEFKSLWQMSPKEDAELRKLVADTDAVYIEAQVLTPEEVAVNRFRPEGWNAETTIDMATREAMQAAPREPENASLGSTTPDDATAPSPGAALLPAGDDHGNSVLTPVVSG